METNQIKIDLDEILGYDRLYRNNLINSLSGFKSANLIGTLNKQLEPNLAVFSSVTHFGSNPPLLGFVTRPHVVPRHTYENIKENGFYTINHIHEFITKAAHHTSAKYESEVDEFEKCGFTRYFSDTHSAPYVGEAHIKLGMEYVEEYHIKANDTILVLGKIKEVITDKNFIKADGFVSLEEAGTVAINGLDCYASTNKIGRYSYARPDQAITEISNPENYNIVL